MKVSFAEAAGVRSICFDDDGAGLPVDGVASVLGRGERADSEKDGGGLGLAIVSELLGEYGLALTLGASPEGGLRAAFSATMTLS